MLQRYYSAKHIAKMYGISEGTVRKHYKAARYYIGRAVRYDIYEVERINKKGRNNEKSN